MEANKYGIILDGKMDEPIWDTVETHTGFMGLQIGAGSNGNAPSNVETEFKILSCEDRIYVGVKCLEPDEMEEVWASRFEQNSYGGHAIEMFFSPTGSSYEFYQFIVTINGETMTQYYSEGGNIRPDYYRPDWNYAVHVDKDHWAIEVEIPLTAFYWTYQEKWSDKWLMNIARDRNVKGFTQYSSWSKLWRKFLEPEHFNSLGGFPIRKPEDDVRITIATADMREQTADGYTGFLTVKTDNVFADEFTFESNFTEPVDVKLEPGSNVLNVPCTYEKLGRNKTSLALVRKSDGKVFKRYYPVLVEYEPIKLRMTQPEYRGNFYPGQDYSKVTGIARSAKEITLKLEGPGIETQILTPDADGNFSFATPNFEIGEAWLTATIDGYEMKKKIRRLAPTGHTMTWISGGNLVVNGKPTLRRNMYDPYYRIGEAFRRRYDAENFHETKEFIEVDIQPQNMLSGCEGAGGEATKDQMPSAEMLRNVDARIERFKDRDFGYYYISDEPECRGLSPAYLRRLYEYIADKDPYHVILTASRSAGSHVDMADWFETHPYIVPYNYPDGRRILLRSISTLGGFVDSIAKLDRPDKCIGFLPTSFGDSEKDFDYPTFDEYICHTWAAMIHGGKSLWPYANHDNNDRARMLEGNRYIFSSFEALEDIVLFGKRTQLYRTNEVECVHYDHGEEKMFVVVNFTSEPQTVTVDGITGTWNEFRKNRTITGNTFTLKPYDTIVATNVVKGADLPTYDEVVALIADLEYERTHGGSLLFDHFDKVTITSSGARCLHKNKLMDGVKDNHCCWIRENPDNFMEVNLTKIKTTFSKVVLHGWKLEDTVLKFRNGEELVEANVAETETEEFSKTFILAESVTPDAMRFEFGGKMVEIYELEVF